MKLSLYNARGQTRTGTPPVGRDFKTASSNGIGPHNPPSYSSDTRNRVQPSATAEGSPATYAATCVASPYDRIPAHLLFLVRHFV